MASGQYKYVVLQATEQAVPFYEAMGFKRIGAVASYDSEETPTVPPVESPAEIRYWLHRMLRVLLRNLRKLDDDGIFQGPVDTKVVTDYLSVVKHPMDFGLMQRKLINREYTCLEDFHSDFRLIFSNAKAPPIPSIK
eukprot:gene30343-37915_t